MSKPEHVRPSFYAMLLEPLKDKSREYGFNLLLHGSLNRDLDLVLVQWVDNPGDVEELIKDIAVMVGGCAHLSKNTAPGGRTWYSIDINRGGKFNNYEDKEWYMDISVTPISKISE